METERKWDIYETIEEPVSMLSEAMTTQSTEYQLERMLADKENFLRKKRNSEAQIKRCGGKLLKTKDDEITEWFTLNV